MRFFHVALLVSVFALLAGCEFKKQADAKFADQHFKTAISLIELHKVRTGEYPKALSEIKFTGDWDAIAIQSVEYKVLPEGYELNVLQGWAEKPELQYPQAFWQGLGLARSNMKPASQAR